MSRHYRKQLFPTAALTSPDISSTYFCRRAAGGVKGKLFGRIPSTLSDHTFYSPIALNTSLQNPQKSEKTKTTQHLVLLTCVDVDRRQMYLREDVNSNCIRIRLVWRKRSQLLGAFRPVSTEDCLIPLHFPSLSLCASLPTPTSINCRHKDAPFFSPCLSKSRLARKWGPRGREQMTVLLKSLGNAWGARLLACQPYGVLRFNVPFISCCFQFYSYLKNT